DLVDVAAVLALEFDLDDLAGLCGPRAAEDLFHRQDLATFTQLPDVLVAHALGGRGGRGGEERSAQRGERGGDDGEQVACVHDTASSGGHGAGVGNASDFPLAALKRR